MPKEQSSVQLNNLKIPADQIIKAGIYLEKFFYQKVHHVKLVEEKKGFLTRFLNQELFEYKSEFDWQRLLAADFTKRQAEGALKIIEIINNETNEQIINIGSTEEDLSQMRRQELPLSGVIDLNEVEDFKARAIDQTKPEDFKVEEERVLIIETTDNKFRFIESHIDFDLDKFYLNILRLLLISIDNYIF